jgi:hypothetical protein
MGLPTTLAGLAAFLIFVVLIVSMSASDLYPNQSNGIRATQERFDTYLNATTNQSVSQSTDVWSAITNVFNFITGIFGMILTFIAGMVQYVLFFLGIVRQLPPEFYILFAIIGSTSIVLIIKLIFLAGE